VLQNGFFQKEIECMDRGALEALQLERPERAVRYCYDNVPFL
jgi:phenylacetate-coenzyme A ligase PaaK-like adenylate-forming protein